MAMGEATNSLTPSTNAVNTPRLTNTPDAPVMQNLVKTSELWKRPADDGVQQRDLEDVALDAEALQVDAADDVVANGPKPGGAVVDAVYAGDVAGDAVAETRAEPSVAGTRGRHGRRPCASPQRA